MFLICLVVFRQVKLWQKQKIILKEAIALYIDTLREDNQPIPEPSIKAKAISVAA
ncbi:type II toxin-antitoxin system HicB family antitoxin [Floridanema aerugineum]|jgi:hypothetical protein|uniref:Type II toxin-antitoxin system HicB family antitoxin n=1 Tax=Floridaenema aerugineum BLCC-F46 TaxID=3153654 RepID=A0ABV4X8K0_9CYAN